MALQGVGYVYVPTISPDRSGFRGAVSRPTCRCIVTYDGRVEHVVSGQVAHFHSLAELLAFMTRVLTDVHPQSGLP
jgi:hypothetical protein